MNDFDAIRFYIEQLKVVYPSIEWRITLNGKVGNAATQNIVSIATILLSLSMVLTRSFM